MSHVVKSFIFFLFFLIPVSLVLFSFLQGFHDIVVVFLITCGESATLAILERLCRSQLRLFNASSLSHTQEVSNFLLLLLLLLLLIIKFLLYLFDIFSYSFHLFRSLTICSPFSQKLMLR